MSRDVMSSHVMACNVMPCNLKKSSNVNYDGCRVGGQAGLCKDNVTAKFFRFVESQTQVSIGATKASRKCTYIYIYTYPGPRGKNRVSRVPWDS